MSRRALITGVAGQDGGYLADLLLSKDYQVFGMLGPDPMAHAVCEGRWPDRFTALEGDLTNMTSLVAVMEASQPDEVYNLAAQSWVGSSWQESVTTTEVNALGVLRLLEAARRVCPESSFLQASSADMFGMGNGLPLSEASCIRPRSPYGAAKAYGHFITINFRESYGMRACSAIMFNHESPTRPIHFVSHKITDGAARIKLGLAKRLELGDLDAARDWGYAGDYVKAMWMMLQADEVEDYVVATGVTHTVRDLCSAAFAHLGLDYREYVDQSEKYKRPAEIDVLSADTTRVNESLGWRPEVAFDDLVRMMVDADLERLKAELG